MVDIFAILSDPTRRSIFEALALHEKSVGELVDLVNISQSGVSRHLKILSDANFVNVRKDGQKRIYSSRETPFKTLDEWLDTYYRKIWKSRFNKLKHHLKATKEEEET